MPPEAERTIASVGRYVAEAYRARQRTGRGLGPGLRGRERCRFRQDGTYRVVILTGSSLYGDYDGVGEIEVQAGR